jgi:hypothetical protein
MKMVYIDIMIPLLLKLISSTLRREKKLPMEYDDPALTTLRYSPIATTLFNNASTEGVSFKRAILKTAKGYYRAGIPECVLNIKSGFDISAHEIAHHHHRISNDERDQISIKDQVLKCLIHEAEAYAIQGLVVLEVYQSSTKDQTIKTRTKEAIERISSIYPEFKSQLDQRHDNESKLQLANNIFKAYLLERNSSFEKHLNYYTKTKPALPPSISAAANSAFVIGLAYLVESVAGFDTGVKTYTAICTLYAGIELTNIPPLKTQSSFQEVFEITAIGDVPTLEGNYLDGVRALTKNDKTFNGTLERISDHVNDQVFRFEKNIFQIATLTHPKIQMAAHNMRELIPAIPQ